ncbi:EscT/YscT/HrcT family type III secretion system export apparatus protein [Jannaschia sp. LMIT008]|uniref:EscT/YscT/HrcT family type III secretion system export apparatus protein n=1 Tax=Jannaschia maritima TaxID=3032585 RepID=UPI0028115034|nr:flagellar biosynthetic protein FliR [Jannaschia sp. LMIT008]
MSDDAILMIQGLFTLMGPVKSVLVVFGLSSARMAGMILVMPLFQRAELGLLLSAAFSFGLGLPIAVGAAPSIAALDLTDTRLLAALAVKEVAIGAVIGGLVALPFWAIAAGGELIDNQRSIAAAGLEDPATKSQASVTASLLSFAAFVVFLRQDGLATVSGTIYDSYAAWPLAQLVPRLDIAARDALVAALGGILMAALLLAAPFVILFLVIDVALAGIGRLAGRIPLDSLLPLVKNLAFCGFALLYVGPLSHFMGAAIAEIGLVGATLRGATP